MDWDKEVTLTLTVRDLYYLQHAADSVLIMGEISNFTVGYEKLTPPMANGIQNGMLKVIKVLKENK